MMSSLALAEVYDLQVCAFDDGCILTRLQGPGYRLGKPIMVMAMFIK